MIVTPKEALTKIDQDTYNRTVLDIDWTIKTNCADLQKPDKQIVYRLKEILKKGMVDDIIRDYTSVGWEVVFVAGQADSPEDEANIFGKLLFTIKEEDF